MQRRIEELETKLRVKIEDCFDFSIVLRDFSFKQLTMARLTYTNAVPRQKGIGPFVIGRKQSSKLSLMLKQLLSVLRRRNKNRRLKTMRSKQMSALRRLGLKLALLLLEP